MLILGLQQRFRSEKHAVTEAVELQYCIEC